MELFVFLNSALPGGPAMDAFSVAGQRPGLSLDSYGRGW